MISFSSVALAETPKGNNELHKFEENSVLPIEKIPESTINFLAQNEIEINSTSMVEAVFSTSDVRKMGSSALRIKTVRNNMVEDNLLISMISDENGDMIKEDLSALVSPRSSTDQSQTFYPSGNIVRITAYYDLVISKYHYVHLTSQRVSYTNNGGTTPSKIDTTTSVAGDLYKKSGSTFIKQTNMYPNGDYSYHEVFSSISAPKSGSTYTKVNAMGTDQYIIPDNGLGGLSVVTESTISGKVYFDSYILSNGW